MPGYVKAWHNTLSFRANFRQMTHAEIARLRLLHQHLPSGPHQTPKTLVSHMGAMQAQDYAMAKWALGIRIPGITDEVVEQALNRGEIIRTHILRPTWHFVAPEDLPWMLALTAQPIRNLMASNDKRLGIDATLVIKTNDIVGRALRDGDALTREEIADLLQREGIATDENRLSHFLMHAELDRIVKTGPRRGKQFTYVRLELPEAPARSREENLAELARRYFTSHGPASVHDFQWWSGLTLGEARKGLAAIGSDLQALALDDQTYYFTGSFTDKAGLEAGFHLLPAFDEMLIAYKSRHISLNISFTSASISSNGIFYPVMMADGQVVGTWKRQSKPRGVQVQPQFFRDRPDEKSLSAALSRFGVFLGQKAEIAP